MKKDDLIEPIDYITDLVKSEHRILVKTPDVLIKELLSFEGFRSKFYVPSGEKFRRRTYTIGYGRSVFLPADDVRREQILRDYEISESEALLLVMKEIEYIERKIESYGYKNLPAGVFCAMVDFAYNVGLFILKEFSKRIGRDFYLMRNLTTESTPIQYAFHAEKLCAYLQRYVYSANKKLPGLVRRAEMRCKFVNDHSLNSKSIEELGVREFVYVPDLGNK